MPEMTVTGELIQMNSHMEFTAAASALIIIGALCAVAFAITAIVAYKDCGWKFLAVMLVFVVAFAVMVVIGMNKPKEQIIHACANGPISLEQIAGRYDIISVDGKELKLRVR